MISFDDRVVTTIARIVTAHPGVDLRQIVEALRDTEFSSVSPSAINHILYRYDALFKYQPIGINRRAWYPVLPSFPDALDSRKVASTQKRSQLDNFLNSLYPWQQRALAAWQRRNGRGVVEAVTGGGKTRLAIAAASFELQAGGRVLIIVPTKDLVEQWYTLITRHLSWAFGRRLRVGRMDGENYGNLSDDDIVVATIQTAYRWTCFPIGLAHGLLIADECHHYGADTWSRALEPGFTARLGLTATYERDDGGIEKALNPYFGGVCYSLGYKEALADDVIAHFKIAFVGVSFSPGEQCQYDDASEKASRYRHKLIYEHEVPGEPFGEFMKHVTRLKVSGEGEAQRYAGFYLSYFNKQREVLAGARAKLERLQELAPSIRSADRSILFSQTKDTAAAAVWALYACGVIGAVLDSDMDMDARRRVFAAFEDGDRDLVAAPKLLDEGIDVPAADLAIIMATSRSRRQMIQRMGRVVRKKDDGRPARIVVLYVKGTSEDPENGAHQNFIDMIVEVADDARIFRPAVPGAAVVEYLNQW